MERLQPDSSIDPKNESSKMHSKIEEVYQKLSEEYEAVFKRGEPVNPANEKHLKMLEDYLVKRGLPHNNYFFHEGVGEEVDEKEILSFVEDYGLSRQEELSQLIQKQDELINDLETNPGNINPKIIRHQIERARRLRSKYVIQYRAQKKI
ncbi:MAG: hypothetical protein UR93_C0028G0008 [Berkelbacteria bacterium GW2011_GWA2_35_9]|uniref:Uncharacterized protein n=1 Tax=Berkelbacteria bacterium GW2011_GWA2_35_9 TaxID=1618333 RepID=A0A0G0DGM8_9BACT|nr:MAG: hypothetical protein UR93_C0028G0008 [Berkelbacteria bacterium GW2011_GWA2_35_9]